MSTTLIDEKQYALASEVAELFRTSTAQIYQWVREGKFPKKCVMRIGKKMLFDREALKEWAANGGSPI